MTSEDQTLNAEATDSSPRNELAGPSDPKQVQTRDAATEHRGSVNSENTAIPSSAPAVSEPGTPRQGVGDKRQAVDSNMMTATWGVIGLFGVLVSLLIQPADQANTRYRQTVSQAAHDAAYPLAQAIKWIPFLVLGGVLVLILPEAVRALRRRDLLGAYILAGTFCSQAFFAVGVQLLAPHVPGAIPDLSHPELCGEADAGQLRSAEYEHETVARIRNGSVHYIAEYWIGYDGERVFYNRIAPGEEDTQLTWVTHRFVVTRDGDNHCLSVVVPDEEVGAAVIKE